MTVLAVTINLGFVAILVIALVIAVVMLRRRR